MLYTKRALICGAMFSCDMFALTELGHIPSVIFGPIGGRLHAPDEWVDLESMELAADGFYPQVAHKNRLNSRGMT